MFATAVSNCVCTAAVEDPEDELDEETFVARGGGSPKFVRRFSLLAISATSYTKSEICKMSIGKINYTIF